MTVSLATFLAPAPRPQGGDKSGKEINADGKAFDDALAGAAARKKPALPQGNDEHPRLAWTIDGQATAEPAGGPMPPAPIRVLLAGELPRGDAEADAPDAEANEGEVQEQEPAETDADATLALLQTMVGKEPPNPERQSPTVGDAAPAVKGSDADLPAAVVKAADAPTSTPPEPAKTVPAAAAAIAAAPAAAPALAAPATRTGVPGHAAERPAQQREPGRGRTDAATSAPSRSASTAPTHTQTVASAQQLGGEATQITATTTPPQPAEAKATPPVTAGQDASAQTTRPDPRAAENAPARLQQQPQPQAAEGLANRVSVVGFNAAVAPAAATTPQPLGATAAGLVTAIEADPAMRAAAQDAAAASASRQPASGGVVQTLRIQLNPVELGMVTARLTVQGQQLSVEIQAETGDARQRLTNDSDAILKALRSVGYDIDTVTIQQAPAPAAASVQTGTAGRDGFQPNQQAQGEGGARGQGDRGAPRGNSEGQAHGAAEKAADRARGDIYI